MKSTEDFEEFKRWFTHYQQLFGLTEYKVYFKCEPLRDAFASISVADSVKVATVTFANNNSKEDKELLDIKQCAKHEAIHLLTRQLEYLGKSRFVREDELFEECEKIAHRLENLIE